MRRILPIIGFVSIVILGGCLPEQAERTVGKNEILIAWRTKGHTDNPGVVDLYLSVSGAIQRDVKVGTFLGDVLTERSYLTGWKGKNHSVHVERRDSRHMEVIQTANDKSLNEPDVVLVTVDIPAGSIILKVDGKAK